jgi:hypothetical protein
MMPRPRPETNEKDETTDYADYTDFFLFFFVFFVCFVDHFHSRTGLHCAPLIHRCIGTAPAGSIRFSLSRFTSEEEVDYTLEIIEKLRKTNEAR